MATSPSKSTITIAFTTGTDTQNLSLSLTSPYTINLEPGPGPTSTTLLLAFEKGSISVSADVVKFSMSPGEQQQSLPTPTSSSPASPLSLGGHRNGGGVNIGKTLGRNEPFQITVKNRYHPESRRITVTTSDSVYVLKTKVQASGMKLPSTLAYKGVTLVENGASLGFHKIGPWAEIDSW